MGRIVKGHVSNNKNRGWLIGHFAEEPFNTGNFEIKFGSYKKGEKKTNWGLNIQAKSMCILIKGKISIIFPSKTVTLNNRGDYVYWDNMIGHSWEVLENTETIGLRWPSIPNDQAVYIP